MGGRMYLGNQKVVPVVSQGGTQETFPVRAIEAKLGSNGYADGKQLYNVLYRHYTDAPFYFDGSKVIAIEARQDLTTSFSPSFSQAFAYSSIKYIDFPNLSHLPTKSVPGAGASMRNFPFYAWIQGTTGVHIYFRALNSQTVFNGKALIVCLGATDATIHFPSNMESIISGVTGYPNFSGTNTTLAFDLPATT